VRSLGWSFDNSRGNGSWVAQNGWRREIGGRTVDLHPYQCAHTRGTVHHNLTQRRKLGSSTAGSDYTDLDMSLLPSITEDLAHNKRLNHVGVEPPLCTGCHRAQGLVLTRE
jgi:hypothetical protein